MIKQEKTREQELIELINITEKEIEQAKEIGITPSGLTEKFALLGNCRAELKGIKLGRELAKQEFYDKELLKTSPRFHLGIIEGKQCILEIIEHMLIQYKGDSVIEMCLKEVRQKIQE